MAFNGRIQMRGDFGNPKGTGYGSLRMDNLEGADAAAIATAFDTFADALVGADFSDCNVGNTSITQTNLQGAAKPGASVNVDAQLVVTWRKSDEQRVRRLAIPGINAASALLEEKDAGLRLTDAGATTLQGLIETLMSWGLGECVIIEGKYLVKR